MAADAPTASVAVPPPRAVMPMLEATTPAVTITPARARFDLNMCFSSGLEPPLVDI
jgi:hypothetical protein